MATGNGDPSTAMYRERTDTVATDRGSGPPLVLSHGTLMDRTMFEPQLDALSDAYRVVAYDSRARTDRYRGPYDLDDLADDCAALMDALDIDSCVLGGMSMGGFMALRFALRYPDRLDGLVLIDSMAGAHTDDEKDEYGEMIAQVEGAPRPPEPLVDVASNLLFGGTTLEERPGLVDRWTARWRTYPGDAIYHEVGSWLDRPSVSDRLGEIEVPALVVHGEEDIALEIERAEPMADGLPDGRLVRVPDAGHSSNLERPDVVNEAIREFLSGVY